MREKLFFLYYCTKLRGGRSGVPVTIFSCPKLGSNSACSTKASKKKDKSVEKANTLMAFSKCLHPLRPEVYPWISQLCEPFYLN